MKKFLVLSVLCSLIACSSSSATKEDKPEEQQPKNVYRNPVIDYSLPDPSVIEGDDGYYYLYATEDIRNLPIHRSKNLVDWEYVGTAFTDRTRPDFEPNGGLWAPDINKIGDKYVLYYSMSVWGGELTCGIGCATADKPEGPFTDHGKMFRSNEINVQNSIDPFYIEDGGKKYLFWGSFRGIYAIELSSKAIDQYWILLCALSPVFVHTVTRHQYFCPDSKDAPAYFTSTDWPDSTRPLFHTSPEPACKPFSESATSI
jgi:arabinan endo-1,5-alpha-L-arabinosidase